MQVDRFRWWQGRRERGSIDGRCGTMVIIKLDLDCIHFARQKFQRRVNEQCDGRQSEGGTRQVPIPSPLQGTPLNGRFRRCCRKHYGNGAPGFLEARQNGNKKAAKLVRTKSAQIRPNCQASRVINLDVTNRHAVASSVLSDRGECNDGFGREGRTAKNENLSPLCLGTEMN